MMKLRVVASLPNDNAYQHQQQLAAKAAGDRLGVDLQIFLANDDAILQSQQLLETIQGNSEGKPAGLLVEPVTASGLRRVAEVAVSKGIGWVISNSDVDYVNELRKGAKVPVFTVTQGQSEIGRVQGKQLATLLPQGGSVLSIQGPSMSSVAKLRHEGMEMARAKNRQLTILRSKWSEESANQCVRMWLKLATSRAEKYDAVIGQTHELALGARKALQNCENPEQQRLWQAKPFLGIGIANQVKPLVDGRSLTAAVVTSVTMDLALRMLVQAIKTQFQPPERTVVETASYPELDKLEPRK